MDIAERDSQDNVRRMAPVINHAYNLGRERRVDEAFETLRPHLEADEVPAAFWQPVGWAVYRYAKAHLNSLGATEAYRVLGHYLRLNPHRPDLAHSYIMVAATACWRQHKQDFPFADFCRAWDLGCLSDSDYAAGGCGHPLKKASAPKPSTKVAAPSGCIRFIEL